MSSKKQHRQPRTTGLHEERGKEDVDEPTGYELKRHQPARPWSGNAIIQGWHMMIDANFVLENYQNFMSISLLCLYIFEL